MIRCDICGEPIEIDHGDDILATVEVTDAEVEPDFSDQEIADEVARTLRSGGLPQDHVLADAFEEKHSIEAHDKCLRRTHFEMYFGEDDD